MPSAQVVVLLLVPTLLTLGFVFVPRRGGTHARSLTVRGLWIVLVVVAVTAIGDRIASEWTDHQSTVSRAQAALVLLACAGFGWLNRGGGPLLRTAVAAIVGGAALNAVPTLVYGGMPVLRSAILEAGYDAADLAGPHPKVGYVLSDGRGWLAHYAGDFIAVPDAYVVISIGDLLLWTGLAVLMAMALRRVAPLRRPSSVSDGK